MDLILNYWLTATCSAKNIWIRKPVIYYKITISYLFYLNSIYKNYNGNREHIAIISFISTIYLWR